MKLMLNTSHFALFLLLYLILSAILLDSCHVGIKHSSLCITQYQRLLKDTSAVLIGCIFSQRMGFEHKMQIPQGPPHIHISLQSIYTQCIYPSSEGPQSGKTSFPRSFKLLDHFKEPGSIYFITKCDLPSFDLLQKIRHFSKHDMPLITEQCFILCLQNCFFSSSFLPLQIQFFLQKCLFR